MRSTVVYFILQVSPRYRHLKIGVSRNIEARYETLKTASAMPLFLLGTLPCRSEMHARETERQLHELLACVRLRGEWFRYPPRVEQLVNGLCSDSPTVREAALERFKRREEFKLLHKQRRMEKAA